MTCDRHERCAYTGTERGLCRYCHRSWATIYSKDEGLTDPSAATRRSVRAAHLREHEKGDAVKAKAAHRREAGR